MSNLLDRIGGMPADATDSLVKRSLESVRAHLGMDVAYLSEFVGDETIFREIDAPGLEHLASVGDAMPLEEVYCRHILAGRLPELIQDTSAIPLCMSLPITQALPIGAHVSVPIRRPDGEVYGMFCCLSAAPRPTLNERDLHIVRAFAGLVAEEIERDSVRTCGHAAKRAAIHAAIAPGGLSVVLQPICELLDGQPVGYEALSRFAAGRSPDRWFADAAEVGLGLELECVAIRAATAMLPLLPDALSLSINASPETVMSGALDALLDVDTPHRLVLELTEHATFDDYDTLCARIASLRARGIRLAIDDAGAGFSGLQHILKLRPDLIKLDLTLIRDIDTDPAKRALASAMQSFARQTGATLIAEGVETPGERSTLISLGLRRGQGYLLGRPEPYGESGLRMAV